MARRNGSATAPGRSSFNPIRRNIKDMWNCDFENCDKSFSSKRSLCRHKKQAHSASEEEKELCRFRDTVRSAVIQAPFNFQSYLRLRSFLGAPIPEINPTEDIEQNEFVKKLIEINRNKSSQLKVIKPYYACFILAIPPRYYYPEMNIMDIIRENYVKDDFEIAIFTDGSDTPGPCVYHTCKKLNGSSDVTNLATKNWRIFANNFTFADGKSHDENKDAALLFQNKWKIIGEIHSYLHQNDTKKKVHYINKSLADKGCRKDTTDKDILECVRLATEPGIPKFIMDIANDKWAEYPLLDTLKRNPAFDQMKPASNPTGTHVFGAYGYANAINVNIQRDEYFTEELKSDTLKRIHTLIKRPEVHREQEALKITCLLALAMLNHGTPIDVTEASIWISKAFKYSDVYSKKYETFRRIIAICFKRSKFFRPMSSTKGNKLFEIDQEHKLELEEFLSKWVRNYGPTIKTLMMDPECLDQMLKGEHKLKADKEDVKKILPEAVKSVTKKAVHTQEISDQKQEKKQSVPTLNSNKRKMVATSEWEENLTALKRKSSGTKKLKKC